jgi:hypothetical protein
MSIGYKIESGSCGYTSNRAIYNLDTNASHLLGYTCIISMLYNIQCIKLNSS